MGEASEPTPRPNPANGNTSIHRYRRVPLAGKREVGLVTLGRRRLVPVVFGEEKDISVVGATALEIFGLEVC